MTLLDENLGVPLKEQSYAEDCTFSFRTIWVSSFTYQEDRGTHVFWVLECNRCILCGSRTRLVWKGVDFERLLVLLGEFHHHFLVSTISLLIFSCRF